MQIEKVKKNKGRKKICTSLHLEQIMCLKDFSKQQKFGEEAKKLWFMALWFRKDNLFKWYHVTAGNIKMTQKIGEYYKNKTKAG